MDCSWPEAAPFDRSKAAEELARGREFAEQLRAYLQRSCSSLRGTASEDLISRILTSFSKTLSMLNNHRSSDHSDDINGCIVDLPNYEDARKAQECGDSYSKSGRSIPNNNSNDGRGCYKRRKNSHSWAKETCRLVDDGHAWRKYGQKTILNAKFPRNYYRCTHKFDQGCQAIKQVQQLEEGHPPKFRTTYFGHHTCSNFLKPSSEIVLGGSSSFDHDSCGGVLLSFDSPTQRDHFSLPGDHAAHEDSSNEVEDSSNEVDKKEEVVVMPGLIRADHEVICSPSDYMTAAHPSPDRLSEVLMGSVVDFEDDVLQFHFPST